MTRQRSQPRRGGGANRTERSPSSGVQIRATYQTIAWGFGNQYVSAGIRWHALSSCQRCPICVVGSDRSEVSFEHDANYQTVQRRLIRNRQPPPRAQRRASCILVSARRPEFVRQGHCDRDTFDRIEDSLPKRRGMGSSLRIEHHTSLGRPPDRRCARSYEGYGGEVAGLLRLVTARRRGLRPISGSSHHHTSPRGRHRAHEAPAALTERNPGRPIRPSL